MQRRPPAASRSPPSASAFTLTPSVLHKQQLQLLQTTPLHARSMLKKINTGLIYLPLATGMRSRSKGSSRCNSAGEKQPSNPKRKLVNECPGTKLQHPPVTPPPQVIDMGLALAKPRECRDDAGLQVHVVTVLNACKRFSTWAQCVRDCVAD